MGKKLNDTDITNELKGASAFFTRTRVPVAAESTPTPENSSKDTNGRTETANGPSERLDDQQHETKTPVTAAVEKGFMDELYDSENGGAAKRITKRYSFEIYEDQIELLDEIKYHYRRKSGRKLAGSKILRDLIDEHLPAILQQLRANQHQVQGTDRREKGDVPAHIRHAEK